MKKSKNCRIMYETTQDVDFHARSNKILGTFRCCSDFFNSPPPDSFLIRFTLPNCNTQAKKPCIWPGSPPWLPRHVMSCPAVARSGRLAPVAAPGRARKRHTPAAAPKCPDPGSRPGQAPGSGPGQASIRSRTSGSSCATTGCQTASSPTGATSPSIAAKPGTASQTSRPASLPSECAIGSMGCDQ